MAKSAKIPPEGPFSREDLASFSSEIFAELGTGSERAVVLVSTSVVDEALRRTLQSFMVDTDVSRELLATRGPIGPMAVRTQLAEALGLIRPEEAKCLDIIRGIRNDYAHKFGTEIDTNSLADRAENLRRVSNSFAKDNFIQKGWSLRQVVAGACVNMLTLLAIRLNENTPATRRTVPPVVITVEPSDLDDA